MEVKPGYRQTEVGAIPEDWRTATLGSLTVLMTNGFVGTATRHYARNDNGILYIQGYNVEENSFNFHGVKYVTEDFHRAHMKSCLRGGDLLTVQTGEAGLTTVVPESIAGANCHALIISRFDQKRVSPPFISFYLNSTSGRSRLKLIETGTTMKHLNVGDVLQFIIPLPPTKAEQEAIAEALSDADAHIESLEQLIAKKSYLKQGAMQELLTGTRRLPGFIEEWNRWPLGRIGPLQRGFDLPNSKLQRGSYPVVYSNGVLNHHAVFQVKGPGVVTGRSGTIGTVTYVERDFWPHNTSLWVTSFKGNDPKFVFYLYTNIGLDRFATGSGVPTLNRNDVHAFEVSIPASKNEQTAIASILSDIDAEIAALEAKLTKARQLKQGMMQELLTGRIRLL
jgi:type I restriction enzyme S subunit